jgi:PTH1 family peptidyl-tRNA hydrolase
MPFWRRSAEPPPGADLRLVVGLGNPGKKYAKTRHNIGFMVLGELAGRYGLTFRSTKHRAETARGPIDGLQVMMALPVTFMNESGNAVYRLVDYYRIELRNLLIVCDDMDLPFGTIRLRPQGSSGGHNGLRSIIQALGAEDFARIRIGVGRPERGAIGHVLGDFTPAQLQLVPALCVVAADAVVATLKDGLDVAMNSYNKDWSALSSQ